MPRSKPGALPLGDTPIEILGKNRKIEKIDGWGTRIRT
jgi:hypothetical protein